LYAIKIDTKTHDVWFYGVVFEDGRSNAATFEFQKSKMAADGHLGYTKMAIASQPVCQST